MVVVVVVVVVVLNDDVNGTIESISSRILVFLLERPVAYMNMGCQSMCVKQTNVLQCWVVERGKLWLHQMPPRLVGYSIECREGVVEGCSLLHQTMAVYGKVIKRKRVSEEEMFGDDDGDISREKSLIYSNF